MRRGFRMPWELQLNTCAECPAVFEPQSPKQRFCSKICAKRSCNRSYREDGRYAARLAEYGDRRREAQRKYSQKHRRANKVPRQCLACGTGWLADRDAERNNVRYCSRICVATGRRGGIWPASPIPDRHPVRSSPIPVGHPARRPAQSRQDRDRVKGRARTLARRSGIARFMQGRCIRCGSCFIADRDQFSNHTDLTCSEACSRYLAKARRRAREREAFVEDVHPWRVFERDEWICRLCTLPLERDAVVPHPLAPTVDHVVPLARGGQHSMANVQAAHFRCNSLKRDTLTFDATSLVA